VPPVAATCLSGGYLSSQRGGVAVKSVLFELVPSSAVPGGVTQSQLTSACVIVAASLVSGWSAAGGSRVCKSGRINQILAADRTTQRSRPPTSLSSVKLCFHVLFPAGNVLRGSAQHSTKFFICVHVVSPELKDQRF